MGFALGIEIRKAFATSEAFEIASVKKIEPMDTITEEASEKQDIKEV